ncbi:acyl carrier protein [Streptomyces flavofungini]|uniref:Acyl carrier protein n=1 Tax=Streptomyces flavofungini TaxID=68200 RepID=A0ABS0XBQ9_9ACTN|nr:acyl carrier protein [Streptomyces flavofungini]MBJ3810650.1 acyl carrier protein [Streptomyces flavofungini]
MREEPDSKDGVLASESRDLFLIPGRAIMDDVTNSDATTLEETLSNLSGESHGQVLLELVRKKTALVLGHNDPKQVGPGENFHSLGFDSLTSVKLVSVLNDATGLQLPNNTVFNHPTPSAVAAYIGVRLNPRT